MSGALARAAHLISAWNQTGRAQKRASLIADVESATTGRSETYELTLLAAGMGRLGALPGEPDKLYELFLVDESTR